MIARVAVWEPMPDDDRQWVLDAAKTVPGVLDAYHLVDPATGDGLSIAFFEDDVDVAEVKRAISKKAEEIRWNDVPRPTPKSETIYGSCAAASPPGLFEVLLPCGSRSTAAIGAWMRGSRRQDH